MVHAVDTFTYVIQHVTVITHRYVARFLPNTIYQGHTYVLYSDYRGF